MGKNERDDNFWNRADRFIHIANDFCDQTSRGKVSSSLLYAAARFSSFVVASSAKSASEIQHQKEAALEYFVGQYRQMLEENLDDQIKNFDIYMNEGDS
jgi:hypothetical protein